MIGFSILLAVLLINQSIAQNCQETGCGAGYCCSRWGFCGDTELHCATGTERNNTYGRCEPSCGPGFCCSRWGFCGNSPLHCEGGQMNNTSTGSCQPPCGPGFCCSRWGFCGDSPLHCDGGQSNNTNGGVCQPPCGAGFCCSRWGFCGDSPLHCAGGGSITTTTVAPPTESGRCTPECPPGYCCSKWGFCGNSFEHCNGQPGGTTTTRGTAATTTTRGTAATTTTRGTAATTTTRGTAVTTTTRGTATTTMTREIFDCIFDQLDPALRDKRWQGYQEALSMASFQPQNQDELMMFFAHVAHETDGLKTYEEYCGQSGQCANDYQGSWCSPVQAEPGKQYYGRGWFQLSWPCNYNAAGKALGIDLLKNPEKVAESDALAAATAMWFWNANNMGEPARNGDFAGTTRKINSIECGPNAKQETRIARYQKVRRCFGLGEATSNLRC